MLRELEEIVMAAVAAWAAWTIHGPFGQEEAEGWEGSMMSCITSVGGGCVVDIVRVLVARRVDVR